MAATSALRWWWSAVVSDVIVIDCTPLHKILQQDTQGQMSDVIVSNSVQSKKKNIAFNLWLGSRRHAPPNQNVSLGLLILQKKIKHL